jgi:hypothetical protein
VAFRSIAGVSSLAELLRFALEVGIELLQADA